MNKQGMFDFAWRTFVVEKALPGYQIIDQRGDGCHNPFERYKVICTYRAQDGSKCIIGHLIPDEMYHPAMDLINENGNPVECLIKQYDELQFLIRDDVDVNFLGDLQGCHDDALPSYLPPGHTRLSARQIDQFHRQIKINLLEMADRYGLTIPPL